MRVEWTEASGQSGTAWANLEDISASGACVQVDRAVPVEAEVRIFCDQTELHGRVRYCVFRDTGYFVGVQFEGGSKWNRQDYRPKHLPDPRRLTRMTIRRALNASLAQ